MSQPEPQQDGDDNAACRKAECIDYEAIKRDYFKLRWTSEGFTDEAGSKVSGVAQ